MAIDKARLDAYIAEITTGMDAEQAKTFTTLLTGNEALAEKSVNGWLRHSDYTKKTQELSQQREGLESSVNEKVKEYAAQLTQADQRIAKIMKDFEAAKISEATANARLLKVKETYQLSDDDIPPVEPASAPPSRKGGDAGPEIDINKRLEEFKTDLVRTLMPELTALTRVSAVQNDIWAQHVALTGKPMTDKDMFELIQASEKEKKPLKTVWEEKYDISKIRGEREDAGKKDSWRKEWETEQAQRRSEEALAGVRNRDVSTGRFSPVLGREFGGNGGQPSAAASPAPAPGAPPAPKPGEQNGGPKLSGAERAAIKWNERRMSGIAPGTPLPVQK